MFRLSCFMFDTRSVKCRQGYKHPIHVQYCFIKDDTTKRDEKDFYKNNITDDAECPDDCEDIAVFEIKKEENEYILDEKKIWGFWSFKLTSTNYKLVPEDFIQKKVKYCSEGFRKESLCTVDRYPLKVYAMAFKEYSRLCKDITKPVQDQDFETETQTTNAKLLGSSEKKLTSNVVI